MILRTMFLCTPCMAAAGTKGLAPRIVVDSAEGVRYTILGCPICGSHDLKVESIAPVDAPATPAPAAAPPSPAPATRARALAPSPSPTAPASVPANDTVIPEARGAVAPLVAGATPPVLAQSVEEAKERKVDFIQLPSRVRCVECSDELTFDVKEQMTDVLARHGWKVAPPRGVVCAKHAAEESKAAN